MHGGPQILFRIKRRMTVSSLSSVRVCGVQQRCIDVQKPAPGPASLVSVLNHFSYYPSVLLCVNFWYTLPASLSEVIFQSLF